jgi:hypothetical protein
MAYWDGSTVEEGGFGAPDFGLSDHRRTVIVFVGHED